MAGTVHSELYLSCTPAVTAVSACNLLPKHAQHFAAPEHFQTHACLLEPDLTSMTMIVSRSAAKIISCGDTILTCSCQMACYVMEVNVYTVSSLWQLLQDHPNRNRAPGMVGSTTWSSCLARKGHIHASHCSCRVYSLQGVGPNCCCTACQARSPVLVMCYLKAVSGAHPSFLECLAHDVPATGAGWSKTAYIQS